MNTTQKIILAVIIVLAIILVIVGIFVLGELFRGIISSTPAPSVPSAPGATATTAPITASDPTWDRIQAAGKLVVGISADYPPFTYIDSQDHTIKGYEIALLSELSRRLSLPLDIKNMAFDGLGQAILIAQIDMAVAAISYTPERDVYIDFSNVYYVGEDAILARNDSNITINQPQDIAAYRVGVQSGSVYETWIRQELISKGLMASQNLLTYQSAEQAVAALSGSNSPINLVMMDALPAETLAQVNPIRIVARGFNPQNFAIGLPTGAPVFQAKINEALNQMQSDGTMAMLAQQYLNINVLPPTPTPAPTQPPATPVGCLDGMAFVQDLNYPDNNMQNPAQFKPGEVFQKGWRIRNTGSCTWDATYLLVYAGSSPLNAPVGGSPVAIAGQVKPGETYDIYATIAAPAQPGVYQSFWTMRNPKGMLFGDRLWAGFRVVSPVTPTPMPEKPVINNFAVTPSSVIEGQCVTLSWNFSGAVVMARIFRDGQVIQQDMPFSGSAADCPPGTGQKEYKLQVDSEHAGSTVSTQFVEVVPPARPTATPEPTQVPPPVINSFSVDFEKIIWGQCVTLSWQYSGGGQVTTTLERNGQSIGGNLPPQGTQKDCPPPGNSDYHLVVDSATSGSTDSSASTFVLLPSPSSYTITFNPDGTFNGKADCNQFSGSYTVSGTTISIAITLSTRNMCQDQSMNELFMGFLPQMNQFAVNAEGKLELTQVDASGRIVSGMVLQNGGPVPQPFEGSPQEGAQAIIGILWQWEKMLPAQ